MTKLLLGNWQKVIKNKGHGKSANSSRKAQFDAKIAAFFTRPNELIFGEETAVSHYGQQMSRSHAAKNKLYNYFKSRYNTAAK